jgi:hypothetical protein
VWQAVLLLAIKTGWSEAEILALPPARFEQYIEWLTQNE